MTLRGTPVAPVLLAAFRLKYLAHGELEIQLHLYASTVGAALSLCAR